MSGEKRERGSGNWFKDEGSCNWRIRYSDHGIMRRESTGSPNVEVAKKLLKKRLAEIETRTFIPRTNVKVQELYDGVVVDYRNQGQRVNEMQGRWTLHLEPFFGRLRASDVGTGHVQRYIESRRDKDGASAASINRELALLRRAFNLGLRTQPPKVRTVPYFTMLKEPKPRRGFLKPGEHDALAQACSDVGGLWLRSIFEVAITFGFRLHEMVGKNGLRVEQIDFAAGIIRLEITKNGDPRDVAMTGTVRSLLKECCRGKSGRDFVFSRGGDPVVTFNRSWKKACVLAGVAKLLCPECEQELDRERHCADCDRDWNAHQTKYSGLLVHDCRRTAVRDLVRAGVPEKIAMTISGHLSREVFERYNIGDDFDLKEAARKLEAYRAHQTEAAAVLSRETEQPLQSAKLQ